MMMHFSSWSCCCSLLIQLLLWQVAHFPLRVNSLSAPLIPPAILAKNQQQQQQQQQQHHDNHDDSYNNILEYTNYWDQLLLLEHDEIEYDFKERRKTWSRQDLISSGQCIWNALAEPDSELYGDKIIRISVTSASSTSSSSSSSLRDKFTRGDVLVMTTLVTPMGIDVMNTLPRECLVMDVGPDWLTAGVGATWPPGLYESRKLGSFRVRLDRTVPRAPLQAQRQALAQLGKRQAGAAAELLATTFRASRSAPAAAAPGKGDSESTTTAATMTRRVQELTSQSPAMLSSSWNTTTTTTSPSYNVEEEERNAMISRAMKDALLNTTFQPNESQAEAIQWALQRRMALIRGPPGTGKTQCAAALIATFLKLGTLLPTQQSASLIDSNNNITHNDTTTSSHRVLAVTHSNGAADVLLEALLKLNVPAVRLGRPALVSPRVQHRTVVAISQRLSQVARMRQAQQEQQQQIVAQPYQHDVDDNTMLDIVYNSRQVRSAGAAAASDLDEKLIMMDAQKMILQSAPVVVTSCIGAHQLMAMGGNEEDGNAARLTFPLVVLDEAAQTTEPALVCALAAARAEQVIFVGDTQQLPPTVTSSSLELRDGLGLSPMARHEKLDIGQVTLQTQYRMPPALLEHPSRYFYGGLVQCVDECSMDPDFEEEAAPPPAGFPWPKGQPLAFVQVTTGNDCEVAHSFGGRSNPTEGGLVVRIIKDLLAGGEIAGDDISVISPYSKQVQLIRSQLAVMRNAQDIRVGTVDSFQGQETGVVIFSAVRSNPLKELGFLRDRRRLCVAITRARRGLILVGDENMLKSCRHWAALLASCEERGLSMRDRDLLERKQELMNVKSASKTKMPVEDALDGLFGGTDDMFGLFV